MKKHLNAKDENITKNSDTFLLEEEFPLIFLCILSTTILSTNFSDFSMSPNIHCAIIRELDSNQRYQNSSAISGQPRLY